MTDNTPADARQLLDNWQALYEPVDARIDHGIRENRQADVTLKLTDAQGQPIADANVEIEQQSHDFLFGSNIFMLGGYETASMNQRYEQAFTKLFNAATVPLYWKDLEPSEGELRFAANSRPIARRPPPDAVVAFCEEHGLNMNGHCLVWDNKRHSVPEWLPDTRTCDAYIEKRIREIGERYGRRIHRWDVLNEALCRYNDYKQPSYMPPGYERLSFAAAEKYLPGAAHQMINETTGGAWSDEDRAGYHQLIRDLQADGAKIDGIGLQWHLFSTDGVQAVARGEQFRPEMMLNVLDEYIPYGKPLHISEITLPALDDSDAARELQAAMVRDTYRVWFSHPAVHAITWWNFPDGGAVPGEDHLASGMIDKQLSPKPVFETMDALINTRWRTNTSVTTDANGAAGFQGFCGKYNVSVNGGPHDIHVAAGADNTFTIQVK